MDNGNEFMCRPWTHDDLPFIQSSWANSYRKGRHDNKVVPYEVFHDSHRPIREKILGKPNVAIIVCCSKDFQEVIIGWIVIEQIPNALIVHYVYVKEAFKRLGIAKELLSKVHSERIIYTHLTDIVMNNIIDKFPYSRFKYIPHLI